MTQETITQFLLVLIPLFLLAAAQAVVMIGGGIDFSLPGIMAASAAAGAWVMRHSFSLVGSVAAMLAVGALLGSLNGLGVLRLRLPPSVVTFASLCVFSGLTAGCPAGGSVPPAPAEMASLGTSLSGWLGVAVLAGLGLHLALHHLVCGRWLRAIGFDDESARVVGIPVERVTAGSYVLSGTGAALAAVYWAAHPSAAGPGVEAPAILVDAVGAAVLGGVRFSGGRGDIVRVFAGAAAMTALGLMLASAGVGPSGVTMVKGVVLLTAASVQARRDSEP